MRVFFVNDTAAASNWGCRATTAALRHMVAVAGGRITDTLSLRAMQRVEPESRAALAGIGERIDRRLRHQKVSRGLLRYALRQVSEILGDVVPATASHMDRQAQRLLRGKILTTERAAIEASDLVVINGEGSIYDKQRKGRMLLFLAYVARRYLDKPTILVNHTASVSDPGMRELARVVYPLLNDVVFREALSAEECADFCKGRIAADAAFVYKPELNIHYSENWRGGAFLPKGSYVCVGGSSIYMRKDRSMVDPTPALRRLIERLQSVFGHVVVTISDHKDEKILTPIAKELDLPVLPLDTEIQFVVNVLGNAAAYVGGRWHPSVLALTGGTPVVALTANTFKTRALLRQIGLPDRVFDAMTVGAEADEIIEVTKDYVDQGDALRARLSGTAALLADSAWENVEYLAAHR